MNWKSKKKHIMFITKDWSWLYNRHKDLVLQFTTKDSEIYEFFKKKFDITNWWWAEMNKNLCNYFDKVLCNYVVVDPHKLLKLDEIEYKRLLAFIDEEPLTNWKDLIVEYTDTINLKL